MAVADYQLFPDLLTDTTTGTPIASLGRKYNWPTLVSAADSGYQQRRVRTTRPLIEYTISAPGMKLTAAAKLRDFAMAHSNGVDAFLFRDPDGYTQTGVSVGTGNGTTLVWQLPLYYSITGKSAHHNASMIKAATLVVKVDNVTVSADDYTIADETGVVTFDAGKAPANGKAITATYEYYRKVIMPQAPEFTRATPVSIDTSLTLTEVL